MSANSMVERDERAIAVENASYRWSYLFVSNGLLALVMYRSFVHHESPWDLLALIILGGVVGTAYQQSHHVLTKRWMYASIVAIAAAAVIAVVIVLLRRG